MAQAATDTSTVQSSLGFDGGLTLALHVKDRKKTGEWYQTVLGFQMLFDVEDIGWCELSTCVPGVNLGLSEVETPEVGKGPVPTFGVKDIDAARRQLEARNVKFDGETLILPDMVKLATFYDIDGNTLMLFESLMPTP